MSPGSPHASIRPRAVLRALERAEAELAAAFATCRDRATLGAITRARREVREGRARARAILKDVDLREAPQPALFPKEGA